MKYKVQDLTFVHVLCIFNVNVQIFFFAWNDSWWTVIIFLCVHIVSHFHNRMQLLPCVPLLFQIWCRPDVTSGLCQTPRKKMTTAQLAFLLRAVVIWRAKVWLPRSTQKRHKHNVLLKVTMIKRFLFVMAFSARKVKPGKKEKSNLNWMLRFILPLKDGLALF